MILRCSGNQCLFALALNSMTESLKTEHFSIIKPGSLDLNYFPLASGMVFLFQVAAICGVFSLS